MAFEDWLHQNLFVHIAIVAVIAGVANAWLARKLPRGWIAGVLCAVPALIVGVLISTGVIFGWMIAYRPGALGVAASDPGGALQYSYLLGLEFGLLGIVIAMIVYAVARYRARAKPLASASPS